jgi:hypothetical protein
LAGNAITYRRRLMTRFTRSLTAAGGLIAVAALIAFGAAGVGAKSSGKADSGTLWFASSPRSTSSLLYVGGQDADKVLGAGAVTFTIKPTVNPSGTITVKVLSATLWSSTGSLNGKGSALLTITNKPAMGDSTVSKGKASLTKGTGALKGHSLTITFTGSGQVSGALYTLHYKGTYK